MGSVLSYSGLSTKIRAMQSRLVTDEQLEEIVQLPNVPQVTALSLIHISEPTRH